MPTKKNKLRVEEPDSAKKQKRGEKWMWESSCTPAERADKGKEKSIQSADTLWEPMASGNLWSPSEVGSEEPDQRSGSCGRVWWSSSLQAPFSLSAFCFPLSNVPVSLGWIWTVSAALPQERFEPMGNFKITLFSPPTFFFLNMQ